MSRITSHRRLRRIRGVLGFLATATVVFVAAASRLDSTGRALAAIGALGCLVAWLVVLDMEGRLADSVERRSLRRRAGWRRPHHRISGRQETPRRVA